MEEGWSSGWVEGGGFGSLDPWVPRKEGDPHTGSECISDACDPPPPSGHPDFPPPLFSSPSCPPPPPEQQQEGTGLLGTKFWGVPSSGCLRPAPMSSC